MPAKGAGKEERASADGQRVGRGGSLQPPAVPLEGDLEVQMNSLRPMELQHSEHQIEHSQIRLGGKGYVLVEGQGQAGKQCRVSGLRLPGAQGGHACT